MHILGKCEWLQLQARIQWRSVSLPVLTWSRFDKLFMWRYPQAEEMEQRKLLPCAEMNEPAIQMKNCNFAWEATSNPLLHDIDLSIKRGQLVMVIGEVRMFKRYFTPNSTAQRIHQKSWCWCPILMRKSVFFVLRRNPLALCEPIMSDLPHRQSQYLKIF